MPLFPTIKVKVLYTSPRDIFTTLITVEPILKIYTLSLLTVVKIDVLDFILGVYLV